MTQALCLAYPMRKDFLAQVVLPRDMTEREAKRICEFIKALAITASKPPRKRVVTDSFTPAPPEQT